MKAAAIGIVVGLVALAAPAGAAAAFTSSQIIASVNAERSANGIPGDLVENATYTQDCAAHDAYAQANGGFDQSNPHGETPGNPGYSAAGVQGGSHSVLATGVSWSAGDPWEDAPYHLLQLMNPRLAVTGADESGSGPYDCLWTIPNGDQRPAASANTLYSFPGDGRTGVPWYEFSDSEYPQSPNDTLGIPRSQPTGFDIQVYWDGPGTDLSQLCAGTVTGPGGAVASQIIDNQTTPSAFADSGLIVPTQPLQPSTTYGVSATFSDAAPCDAAHEYSHSFSFTTAAKQPADQMMHVDDAVPTATGTIRIPYRIDQPLARGSGKITIESSGYLASSTATQWQSGYFELPPPPAGQWVRVTLRNDAYSIGATTWDSTSVSRTFNGPSGGGGNPPPAGQTGITGNGGTVTADKHGAFVVPGLNVSCGPGPCRVSMTAKAILARRRGRHRPKASTVASAQLTLGGDASGHVTIALPAKARSALARLGSLRVTVAIAVVDAAGKRATRTVTVTVRAPHRRRR